MNELLTPLFLYIVTITFCLKIVFKINGGRIDYFDPGFLFLIFVSLTFVPLTILTTYLPTPPIYSSIGTSLFVKTIFAHTLLIFSFTLGYFIFTYRSHGKKFVVSTKDVINTQALLFILLVLIIIQNYLII